MPLCNAHHPQEILMSPFTTLSEP